MDLQVKLVNDGQAATYESPEIQGAAALGGLEEPGLRHDLRAARVRLQQAPGAGADVPQDHADAVEAAQRQADIQGQGHGLRSEKSGVGYLFCNEDIKDFPQAWDLFKAFGKTKPSSTPSAGAMMERVSSGEHLIGYDIFGSYALGRSKKDPNLGIVLPKDYTLVTSRVTFISKKAKNPNAAKLFLDYLLSKRGQRSSPTRPSSIRCAPTSRARRRSSASRSRSATRRARCRSDQTLLEISTRPSGSRSCSSGSRR